MVCANPNRVRVGETDLTISELCAGQATKIVLDGSAEPCKQMDHMKHKKKQNIFRHIQTKECVYVCETSELAESVLKLKQNGWWETGNVISKLCSGQATKKGVGE